MGDLGIVGQNIIGRATALFSELEILSEAEQIAALNALRLALHAQSPFKDEPVDCVIWIEAGKIEANDYNPNAVAPPEMKLLELSITEDG